MNITFRYDATRLNEPEFVRDRVDEALPNYFELSANIDHILGYLTQAEMDAGTEGLNSNFLTKMFVGIVDTFLAMGNTFITKFTQFGKDLKRSEIKEYVQSNKLKVAAAHAALKRAEPQTLNNLQVDAPSQMKAALTDAYAAIVEIYSALKLIPYAEHCLAELESIASQMENTDVTQAVKKFATNVINAHKPIVPLVAKCQTMFSGDRFQTKYKFGAVYKNAADFEKCTNELYAGASYLQDVAKITKLVDKFETSLKNMTTIVETCNENGKTVIDANTIKNFGEAIKKIAFFFDTYAMASTRQMAIEHNHVLNINTVYQTVK